MSEDGKGSQRHLSPVDGRPAAFHGGNLATAWLLMAACELQEYPCIV